MGKSNVINVTKHLKIFLTLLQGFSQQFIVHNNE